MATPTQRLPRGLLARAAALAVLLLTAWPVVGAEYRSVGAEAAVLFDGPSEYADRRFIVVRGTPLLVISSLGQWVKVQDIDAAVLWIRRTDLSGIHTVMTAVATQAYEQPNESAELVMRFERGVILQFVEPASEPGWVNVRHADGTLGYMRVGDLWGI
jgi:SH3-like domain-containing protein